MAINRADLLSYSVSGKAQGRLEVLPSPALELAYGTFFLSSPKTQAEVAELAWARELPGGLAEPIAELKAFSSESCRTGFELLVAACRLGYVRDPDPRRLLADLPRLPERLLALLEGEDDPKGVNRALYEQLVLLREPQRMSRYGVALQALWEALEPVWQSEGERTVRRECQRLERSLAEGKSVLNALPKHHFTRFEHAAAEIARHLAEGALVITPLFFAAGGGFQFDVAHTLYLGYGLHSDASYARLSERVRRVAAKGKGFADPTRLLILALISRFELTVGDLVAQLEVSQPTVSGHLKLLKDEELVTVRKEGNKAYYRVNAAEVERVLEELRSLLLQQIAY